VKRVLAVPMLPVVTDQRLYERWRWIGPTSASQNSTTLQDIEDSGNVALGFLAASVRSIPRVSNFTGEKNDLSNPVELKALAARVKEEHERFLAEPQQQILLCYDPK